MPKIFVISDVHSAYTPMKKALDDAGFEIGNPNHLLISCGDNFDRMDESQQVLDYLMGVPNKVLVFGNHELLIKDLCERKFPYSNDFSNGTHKTVCDLAPDAMTFDEACNVTMEKIKPLLDQMVNYFETKNYIFCHSYIALKPIDGLPKHYTRNRIKEYNPNWRNATDEEWDEAMWGNPFQLHLRYGHNFNKTIVCGHWHTSWPRVHLDFHTDEDEEKEFDDIANFEPYYMDGLIGIDGCVAHTHKVNVLVIEDDFLE